MDGSFGQKQGSLMRPAVQRSYRRSANYLGADIGKCSCDVDMPRRNMAQ